jgi:hypothetical protein
MRSFWSDPYLWIHVAGVAALPITLEVCLLGLAVGDPFLPEWLELFLITAIGVTPILLMQWQRPFYIFSLLAVALQPSELTIEQRKLLHFFKTFEVRLVSLLVPVLLTVILWQLYQLAPLVMESAAFIPQWRGLGLLIAAIAFLASNLFLQVPASVLRVLLANDASVAAVEAYPVEKVTQDFTLIGLRVKQIVPTPKGAPVSTAIAPPEATPVAPPEATPEAIPEAIAEVSSEAAPEAIQEVIPEVSSEAIQEAIAAVDPDLVASPSAAEAIAEPTPTASEPEAIAAAEPALATEPEIVTPPVEPEPLQTEPVSSETPENPTSSS